MAEAGTVRRRIVVFVAVVLSAAGVAVCLYVNHRDRKRREAEVAAAREQIALKIRGLALLENARYAEADRAFSRLADELPGEPLGPRNLLITRLLAVDQIPALQKPAAHATAIKSADAALNQLRQVDGESAVTHHLAARLAQRKNREEQVIRELVAAARLAPQDPAVRFELYTRLRDSGDPAKLREGAEWLAEAYRLRPDNLALLLEWLAVAADAKDAGIAETLKTAENLLAPFAAGIEQQTQVDLIAAIQESTAAAANGDWQVVSRNARLIGNVVRPEVAVRIDHRRVSPHLLELVEADFSPLFYELAKLPAAALPQAIDVKFVTAPAAQQLPQTAGVRDVELADFDLDGRLDVILLTAQHVTVFGRKAEAENWQKIAEFELPAPMRGIIAADLDRDHADVKPRRAPPAGWSVAPDASAKCLDADVDLVVYGEGAAVILQNKQNTGGMRSLEAVPQDEAFRELGDVHALAAADVDHDGDLDLVVSADAGLSIWSNRDNFTFEEISGRSALPPAGFRASTIVPVDWNRDLSLDLLLADASGGPPGYLENLLHGRFRWRQFAPELDVAGDAAGLAVAELDGNASWDLIAVGKTGISRTLTIKPGGGIVGADREVGPSGTEQFDNNPYERILTWDYDNDGYRDLLAWKRTGIALFRGLPDGRFERTAGVLDPGAVAVSDCEVGDLDGDGDWDLLLATPDGISLYYNEGGNANAWIDVRLSAEPTVQRPADRTNMHGIGSLLELKAGRRYQAQVISRQTTHFGLGPDAHPEAVRILWTNGIPEDRVDPATNETICAKQDLKGSCPYLYAWDGKRFSFFTDCLWSSPIGLQLAEGVLAPARHWEYLLIPGERLAAKDGEYRLKFTEELWEAAYFDRIQLIAVDHPVGVAVYSNEKVGPAEIAQHMIHTVRNPRPPLSAVDKHGRDVLPEIAHRDGKYLQAFDRRRKQGLTDEHYVQLDLGRLENPQRITLFLTGWVFPTDTSLNVAISQNPDVDPPRPPFIQVPDTAGNWIEAISYTGFPGGKTKTIAVDVSGIFPADDYRLRLASSMELYWDQMFFTVDEEPAVEPDSESPALRTTELPLIAADLHYRGFSRRIEHPGHGPESYDYARVEVAPKWPPMAGRFTRYGDVGALLEEEDDRLVVLGAGDEISLSFRVPASPGYPLGAAGWTRDFLLYNVGWDKDADLNTVYGQTVEPLPFRDMHRYPYAPEQSAPTSRAYLDYLNTYQTRTQTPARFWKRLLPSAQ